MENQIWTNLDVKIENHKEVLQKLNEGFKKGFGISGVKIKDILIARKPNHNGYIVFYLNTSGNINDETIAFSIKNKDLNPYQLYKAIRLKIKDFARRERRDQEALDRIFGKKEENKEE